MCKVTSGVAWRPVSHMCVRVSDLWRGMASRKSLTSVFELKSWMLRQPDQNNKGCPSIRFLLREFCNLRLLDLNNYLNIASNKKQSHPKDFLRARFVKKGYMEMIEYYV